MSSTDAASSAAASDAEHPKRGFRDTFEGFGIALLMAVFFKYFAIEAYQIPTSSMQPTMMGSPSHGVYDRLIVDKWRYSMVDPNRWEIAVFKYPIRQNQNYVKRIVGMPGDRLRIGGGNIYTVAPGATGSDIADLTTQRKPEALQPYIWKNVFPSRMEVTGGDSILGTHFSGSGSGEWSETDGTLTFKPRRSGGTTRAKLTFANPDGRGLDNVVWDGYPTEVARAIREKEAAGMTRIPVQDARLALNITPETKPESIIVEISVEREKDVQRLALHWENDKGVLEIRDDNDVVASSEPFDWVIEGGATQSVRFSHVDDRLVTEVDGVERARLDCDAHRIVEPVSLVTPFVRIVGGGTLRIADLSLDRDLHYIPTTSPGAVREPVIEVPDGHYMMFGDNTLQSVDSRDWTKLTIGVEDGKIVNPKTHPQAQLYDGNLRPVNLSSKPDPDENPVPITSLGKVVFTDRAGEIHTFDGQVNLDAGTSGGQWAGDGLAWFADEENGAWAADKALVQFVPREHIIGRPLLNFWPVWSPFRFGLIR